MTLAALLWTAVLLFPVSEIALAAVKHSGAASAQAEDRGSLRLLWVGIGVGVGCAVAAKWVPAGLPLLPGLVQALALVLLVAGLIIRWVAIFTLGRFFTVDVAIHADHQLVERGLYRLVRHPSYTGLLLAFLGLGLSFANWLSLLLLLLPIGFAVRNRVLQEERALLRALGAPYAEYCARTPRLIPRLF